MQIAEQLSNALRDRYRIEREIGSGGMATVYLAHDVRHERSSRSRRRIPRSVAAAVEYAHAHGVVRRGLKPENILIT